MSNRGGLSKVWRGCWMLGLTITLAGLTAMPTGAFSATSISPASGPVGGGNKVTIKGEGFEATITEKFQDLAAGVEHAVLLSQSGHVWTVGRNSRGQLGAGKLVSSWSAIPLDITDSFNLDGDDTITRVAAGDYYSFAISRNNRVFAWGSNQYGELGCGDRFDKNKPVEITDKFNLSLGDYITEIKAGVQTTYASSNNGQFFYWGDSKNCMDGKPNCNSSAAITTPENITDWSLDGVRLFTTGYLSGAVVQNDETIQTWGRNSDGELARRKWGEENYLNSPLPRFLVMNNFDLVEGDKLVDIEAGNGVMMALTLKGFVYAWGTNAGGMLGLAEGEMANPADSDTGDDITSIPTDITDNFDLAAGDQIAQISVGNSHVLALSDMGRVFSWGAGNYGQLGTGDILDRPVITEITDQFDLPDEVGIQKVVAAGSGNPDLSSYSYALDDLGNVYSWGGDRDAKPGINQIANVLKPTKISDRLKARVSDIVEVRFGDYSSIAIGVLSNESLQAIVPAADTAGKVTVTLVNSQGDEVDVPQAYAYLDDIDDSGSNNSDDSTDGADDDQTSDDDNQTDEQKDENKDKDDEKDSNNVINLDNLTDEDILSLQKALTEVGSAYTNIKAPNTGSHG